MSLREKIRAYRPEKPQRVPVGEEERRLVNMKFAVWREWEASGLYTAKNPDGSWKVTAADCAAEAKRRLAGQSERAG